MSLRYCLCLLILLVTTYSGADSSTQSPQTLETSDYGVDVCNNIYEATVRREENLWGEHRDKKIKQKASEKISAIKAKMTAVIEKAMRSRKFSGDIKLAKEILDENCKLHPVLPPECKNKNSPEYKNHLINFLLLSADPLLISEKTKIVPDLQTFKKIISLNLNRHLKSKLKTSISQLPGGDNLKKIRTELFPEMMSMVRQKIDKLDIAPEAKDRILRKLEKVHMKNESCEIFTDFSLQAFYVKNAFLNPSNNGVTFCPGYLDMSNNSAFFARVLVHEIGHSIDPCNQNVYPDDVQGLKVITDGHYFLPKLLSCLRSSQSVNAKKDPKAKVFTCVYDNKSDQINESFCDWLSAEVLPHYVENLKLADKEAVRLTYMESFVGNTNGPNSTFGEHPDDQLRLNHIYLQNPKIREQMGCPPIAKTGKYCGSQEVPGNSAKPEKRSTPVKGVR
jgi:hypothetical protein